jgi:heme-degrading monooxygenase HmoA
MSVIITLELNGDPKRFEEFAEANADRLRAISAAGQAAGVIGHRFYGADGNRIMVIDEWPDADSFHRFFTAQADAIGPMMAEVGIEGEPQVTVWHELESHDQVGWD